METRARKMTVREVSELDIQLESLRLGEQELYRQDVSVGKLLCP